MDGYAAHSAPCYHPGGDGAVYAAGEQGDGPAVRADGQSAGALGRGRVDVGGVVAHLKVHDELRVTDVHLRLRVCLGQQAADVLGELDAGQVEALVRALRLDLEARGVFHVLAQVFDGELCDGVLVLLAGGGAGERHYAEGPGERFKGGVHVRRAVLRLDIHRGLHAVDAEIAQRLEPLPDVGEELLLKVALVEPLEHHLALF